MGAFVSSTIRIVAIVALGAGWSGTVSVLLGPWILDGVEAALGTPLTYEESVRIYILTALGLFLTGWFALVLLRPTMSRLIPWLVTATGCGGIAAVCAIDQNHALRNEYSWIRYLTAAFLLFASVTSALVWCRYRFNSGAVRSRWLWGILTFAFAALAGDELLMLHERFGEFFENHYGMDKFYTDLITLTYAVGALVFVALVVRMVFGELVPRHLDCVQLFVLGVLTFGLSQVLDTFDFWIHDRLSAVGDRFSAAPESLLSDFWYPLWGPKQFSNDLEEVLEAVASMLLSAGVLVILVRDLGPTSRELQLGAYRKTSFSILAVLIVGSLAAAVPAVAVRQEVSSPVLDTRAAAVAKVGDGLSPSGDIFFHPVWGLLVANERTGAVGAYKDGKTRPLPDPEGLVTEADSLAATDDAVYVSVPSLAAVFKYTDEQAWEAFVDGLGEPEGLVVVASTLYVVDGSSPRIYAIDLGTRRVDEMIVDDPRWRDPEGIAFHPGLGRLLIADTSTGYVSAVKFGEPPAVFFSPGGGLESPKDIAVTGDGRVFVTDSVRRELVELDQGGAVLRRLRFRRMYGYLAGVAVAGCNEGEMFYVVTSGRESFPPAVLWELGSSP